MHNEVKKIIQREILSLSGDLLNVAQNKCQITFADVCNWQKELFEYKRLKQGHLFSVYHYHYVNCNPEMEDLERLIIKSKNLPNQHINLGLRTTNVKVGNWTPPHSIFLEELKEMCFPISTDLDYNSKFDDLDTDNIVNLDGTYTSLHLEDIKFKLTHWYKIFQTIHFFEDFNGRLGGIVINILSYILTGKYMIRISNN